MRRTERSSSDSLAVMFFRKGGGEGGDCRRVTPGLNGLLEPPKTVPSFTVVASENFTDFSVTTE